MSILYPDPFIILEHCVYADSKSEHLSDVFDRLITDKNFLDLGSGVGLVVEKALNYTSNAFGIEIEPWLIDLSIARSQIIEGDYFETDLSIYDVLYYYIIGTYQEDRLVTQLENELSGKLIVYDYEVEENWKNGFYARLGNLNLVEIYDYGRVYSNSP